jgi:hypothetical protein
MSINDNKKKTHTTMSPMPEVLETLSGEVRLLAGEMNELQELISNLVVAGAFGGSNSLYKLQSMDRIWQSLEAISDYLGGVSNLSSPSWKIDVVEASRSVKLAEVSERLRGIKRTQDAHHDAGDFEDFVLSP